MGIGQGVLDRYAHVREAQLSLQGAVGELDQRVNDALGMDDDVDLIVSDIVQPACFDDLQRLVHEGRGVDVILEPMRHVGWARASRGGGRPSRSADQSRNGPPEAVRMRRVTSLRRSPARHCQMAECSESIGRSQLSGICCGGVSLADACREVAREWHDQVAAGDERLLVGRGDDLARLESGDHRPQTDYAARPYHDHVDALRPWRCPRARRPIGGRRRRARGLWRATCSPSVAMSLPAARAHDLELVRMRLQDVERLAAD